MNFRDESRKGGADTLLRWHKEYSGKINIFNISVLKLVYNTFNLEFLSHTVEVTVNCRSL